MKLRIFYTWKAPGDQNQHELADSRVCKKKWFGQSVNNVHTLNGADIDSDQYLLFEKYFKIKERLDLKKIVKFQKRKPRWNSEELHDPQ